MQNRIRPQSIRRDVPHTSVSNPNATPAASAVSGALLVDDQDPVERLAGDFARWASNKARITTITTITGDRLLRVLRILGRPTYRLAELNARAEQAAKVAAWSSGDSWEHHRQAARAAQKAVDDAYSSIMRDVDTLFTALTGVPADTAEALDLEVPLQQIAADARLLLAVGA